jgi:hypothetical protein
LDSGTDSLTLNLTLPEGGGGGNKPETKVNCFRFSMLPGFDQGRLAHHLPVSLHLQICNKDFFSPSLSTNVAEP